MALVQGFLKQDIMEDMKRWTPISGSPQGAVISPLLANIYLHELDVEMREAGLVMVRYADDAVVLCRSREEAESALARMRAWVSANGLTLHPDKTHVGDCRVEGQGFEFLGYRFEAGQRWVRKKSLMSLRDNIRAKTKRNEGHSIDYVIASLNPTLRGWYGYSSMLTGSRSPQSTALYGVGCGRCCAGRNTDRVKDDAYAITNNGQMPSSLNLGCSRCLRPIDWRANPDVETTDWRARRGRTAQRVRREGTATAVPYPYHSGPSGSVSLRRRSMGAMNDALLFGVLIFNLPRIGQFTTA